jgi:hypothetical protein
LHVEPESLAKPETVSSLCIRLVLFEDALSVLRRQRFLLWACALTVLSTLAAVGIWRFILPAIELQRAEGLLQHNKTAAARARLESYLIQWPADAHGLLLAAKAARLSDAYADAESFLTTCQATEGSNVAANFEWDLLGAQQGDFPENEDRLRRLADKQGPGSAAVLEALGKGYYASFRRQDAIGAVNKLLEQNPGHVPALILRGTIWASLRRNDPAEQDLRKAVQSGPQNAAAHLALADLLNHLGHTREAIYHYNVARSLGCSSSGLFLGLARALADDSQLDEAQRQLADLLALFPDHQQGLLERARLNLRKGRSAEAEVSLTRIIQKSPWHREANRLLLIALSQLKRNEAAKQQETIIAKLKDEDGLSGRLNLRAHDVPTDIEVRLELWRWAVRNERQEEGLPRLFEIVRFAPRHPATNMALADYFEHARQPRRAKVHREIAVGSRTT